MKRRMVNLILTVSLTVTMLAGCRGMITSDNTEAAYKAENVDTGLYIGDASQDGTAETYYINTMEDYENLLHVLESRNGKTIIEVSTGTVINSDGDGVDSCGYYRHYNMDEFEVGDTVESVFVYNPDTNYIDDIMHRTDTLIE